MQPPPNGQNAERAASGSAPALSLAQHSSRLSERTTKSSPMRIMARLLGERKGLFAGNLLLRLIKDLLPFGGPILVGIIVDLLSGENGRDRSIFGFELLQDSTNAIVAVAVLMALLAVAKTAVGYAHTIVAAHVGRHVVQAARRDLAEASMQMALDERRRFNSGDLLDRCLADSKGLRGFTQNVIIRIISNTVRAVFPLTLMFMIDPLLAVIVLAVIPLQSGFSGLLQRRLQRQTHDARSSEAAHTSAVKEAIDGWNSVASVGGQDWAAQGINATAAASEDAKIIKKHTTASISAVISLCTAFGIAAVYAVGGWRIVSHSTLSGSTAAAGALTLGSLTTFIGVAKKTYAPFRAYTKIVSNYRTGLVNLERIADVLDAPMIDAREHGPELHVSAGDISLDGVSFSYNEGDTPTLRELTGVIPGRSLTVITGSSGAGKTTLLRLLLGLDVPSSGTVSIDGQDINEAKLASVQKAISLVPQEPVLFTGTLGENLLLGLDETTTQELIEACDRSGLIDLVRELPKGLDTEVGSGKHMLSGGQLRRMAIARALLRKPAILLLDEPTTGLDVENSMLVLSTLRRISGHTTVVMVSHRRDPLEASDHHLVLRDGGWSHGDTAPMPTPTTSGINGHAAPIAPAVAAANGSTSDNGADHVSVSGQSTHVHQAQQVLALSAMGRPIVLNAIEVPDAQSRVLLVSGHRSSMLPITAVAPAVFAQVASDAQATVALGSIEDVNPDGAFASDRTTVLGVQIDADHRQRRAAETRALHAALDSWNADLMIDIGARSTPSEGARDVDVVVRFTPTSDNGAPDEVVQFGQAIRRRLDQSQFNYHVSLVGCLPDSVTTVRKLSVVELTTEPTHDPRIAQALIEATVAVYRSAASGSSSRVSA